MSETSIVKPWLIGENNPYLRPGDPPHKFDLYPLPEGASGHRLCRLVLGMQMTEYLRSFVRRDLLTQAKWSITKARFAAEDVLRESGKAPLVLLGKKVCAAFGVSFIPHSQIEHGTRDGLRTFVIIPHPSGLNRMWDEPGAYERARNLIMPLVAESRGAA